MKKLIALSLTMTLIIINSMTVFAADKAKEATATGSKLGTAPVEWSYNPADGNKQNVTVDFVVEEPEETYLVTITWGAMKFKYDGAVKKVENQNYYAASGNVNTWTPLSIEGDDGEVLSNTIIVTNQSTVKVNATLAYISDSGKIEGVGGTFTSKQDAGYSFNVSTSQWTIPAAEESEGVERIATLSLSGVPSKINVSEEEKLNDVLAGEVTISLEVPTT
ncbi:MAG: hypothetical protein E7262_01885 [Lachnospiraceae bacterium]|nr:hypothetical protein [Lachnospiraceae bacterium]